ncbi:hypothetical protein EBQ90_01895 [bacterium]|nr:hypothetical protein [bacterium]
MTSWLWLVQKSQSTSAATQSFISNLRQLGISITVLELSHQIPTYDWLSQHVREDHQVILFSDPDIQYIKNIRAVVDLLPSRNGRIVTWLYETLSDEQLGALESAGFDELISVQDAVSTLPLRMERAALRTIHQNDLKRQIREFQMKEAKAETTVAQREEFLSVCAHDLRSPLGLIHSSLSLLAAEKSALTSEQLELMERAKRQAEHGIRLVNDLLDVMAYEQGLKPEYQLVDLEKFLKTFHQDYVFQAKQKSIHIRYDNPLGDWRVLIDPDRIQQLFQNLVVNAIKFTDPGKKIFINVLSFKGRRKNDPPYPMVIVSVRDEGRGIPEAEVQRIFNRFSQIKDYSRLEGRGLGLSVAKQISNLHDGNLWVKSVEGEGSTFFVLFPHVLSEPKRQEKSVGSRRTLKVLIVEPHPDQQSLLSASVARWGFEPLLAKDGIEMVTLGFYHQPQYILVGSELSKLNEEQAAKILKRDLGMDQTPIFKIMGSETLVPHLSEDTELDGVLKLPLNRTHFERAVQTFLEKKRLSRRKTA